MSDNVPAQIVPADGEGIAAAVAALRAGALVAVPTETVYGLAARADRDESVAAIYRAKGRPDFNPLIVHVADLAGAEQLALVDARARVLADAFWPGPLTMVLPRREGAMVAAAVTAGLPTIAIRCPAHRVMRQILRESGLALAAPSANASGGVSPTCAAHVAASLGGRVGLIVDGGDCPDGIESTIIALRAEGGWQVLRPGPITADAIAAVIGQGGDAPSSNRIEAPGQMTSHYAPGKPVRLNALTADAEEFHIGFGAVAGDYCLSADGDLAQAAAHLYAALHAAAASGRARVAVAPVPDAGIGAAINDRLRRAAA
ncbi:threonylcarbamoyl-AMP synthase [Novosphingobium sp. FSY-8]|uniref:Threonylcarbamoyl-AMP synthase n=1 Tax=Novosphingobium ovatum TaxID=1908523 RepID=A0ABW9XHC5_9SPHN|nr:L-threonylcarbamoyladenylate synthase [Novosphingobium ovatum]NBC37959.1 threonylcarbamoyl-AMP synthase [Novosphingobium ovatum]